MYGVLILSPLLSDIKPRKKEDVKYFGGCFSLWVWAEKRSASWLWSFTLLDTLETSLSQVGKILGACSRVHRSKESPINHRFLWQHYWFQLTVDSVRFSSNVANYSPNWNECWCRRHLLVCLMGSGYTRVAQKVMPHIFFLGNYLFKMYEIHAQYNWMFPLHMLFFHITSI